jgi:hypothetical protein
MLICKANIHAFAVVSFGMILADIGRGDDLIESGIIDSLGIWKLLEFLESKFSINIGRGTDSGKFRVFRVDRIFYKSENK